MHEPRRLLHRIRITSALLTELDLDDYSGIFLGGGTSNSSDTGQANSAVKQGVTRELILLLDQVVVRPAAARRGLEVHPVRAAPGWRFVVEELQRAGVEAHLAEHGRARYACP